MGSERPRAPRGSVTFPCPSSSIPFLPSYLPGVTVGAQVCPPGAGSAEGTPALPLVPFLPLLQGWGLWRLHPHLPGHGTRRQVEGPQAIWTPGSFLLFQPAL